MFVVGASVDLKDSAQDFNIVLETKLVDGF